MTNTNTNYRIVYRMDYAMRLKKMGHIIAMTMPNPKNSKLNCWAFIEDETFDADFDKVRGKE